MATTTRLLLPYPLATENVSLGPSEFSTAFGILDNAALYGEGTLAGIGLASAHPKGYLYRCTDAGVSLLFVGDGTNWHSIPTDFGAQPIGSITQYAGSSIAADADGVQRWKMCDGTPVSRTTYATLFTKLSTTFGTGDGSTTFNLPDLRGRTPVGAGTGSGLTARTLGGQIGAETIALTEAQLAAHTHGGTTGSAGAHAHGNATGNDSPDHSHYSSGTTGSDSPDHAHGYTGTGWTFTYAGGSTGSYTVWAAYGAQNTGGASARHAHSWGAQSGGASARHTHSITSDGAHSHTIASDGSGTAHDNVQPGLVLNSIIRVI